MGENLVPDAAVQAIQDSVRTATIKVSDEEFATRPVFAPPTPRLAEALQLNTLSGLAEYVNNGPDNVKEEAAGLAVHVVNEVQVDLIGGLFGRYSQRTVFATATARAILDDSAFVFRQFYDCETFIIKLQSIFEEDEWRAEVLKVVGNIKEEAVRQIDDDGVTQAVTARSGIARVGEVRVPNPAVLAPYRTFRELEQPTSPFILRMKQGSSGSLPTVALFEADGGKWKLDAIESIRQFLSEKITGVPIIA